ncbi:hypothetical protein NHQ30_007200 [Ciborinia camelliae]|nr:hypothetical protein NHQ30_007200 [Ciborinia camelliae]
MALKFYGMRQPACTQRLLTTLAEKGIDFEFILCKRMGCHQRGGSAKYLQSLDNNLAVYNQILSKQKYLAGEEFTLTDLYYLPHGTQALKYGFQDLLGKYPHLYKRWEGLQARDSSKQLVAGAA